MKSSKTVLILLILCLFALGCTHFDLAVVTTNNGNKELPRLASPGLEQYDMIPNSPYQWIEISGLTTPLPLYDDSSVKVPLGFQFTFYNQIFTDIWVHSNGYLSFVSNAPSFSNQPFPQTSSLYHYMIAPFWDDLCPYYFGIGGGYIYAQSFPGYWIAEWKNIDHYIGSEVGTFQVILYESGKIVFNYQEILFTNEYYTCGLNYGLDTTYYNIYYGLYNGLTEFSIHFLGKGQYYIMEPGASYQWIEISEGNTPLVLSDDDSELVDLGFEFTFYDQTFTNVWVCSNGFLSFSSSYAPYYNQPFPLSDPPYDYMIAPFWDDLMPLYEYYPGYFEGGGEVYVQSFPDYWIAEWKNIYHFWNGPEVGTFQVILHESGEIFFNYQVILYTGGDYTCGLNRGGGLDYYNSYVGLYDGLTEFSIRFYIEEEEELENYIMILDCGHPWIEISEGNTPLVLSDDDSELVNLGFEFTFYDQTFTNVWVCSNGFLSFSSFYAPYSNQPFPQGPPYYYMIAPFWDDLNPFHWIYPGYGAGGGEVYVQSFPGYWIAEWKNIVHYYDEPEIGTFQVILYESGKIVFNYQEILHTEYGYTCGLNYGLDQTYYNSYDGLYNGLTDFSLCFLPSVIPATIDFDPDTLNSKSHGRWVTVYIELPEGYDVNDILVESILLNDELPAETRPTGIGDHDSDGIPDLMVKFNRSAVIELFEPGEDFLITITGELVGGVFIGTDEIRTL